jgi:predicted O-methyltransferase YrrM
MNESTWSEVDAYFAQHLLEPDDTLQQVLAANSTAGLPAIDVSPVQGKLLYLQAKMIGARRVLEIGTLGGYSTIWLARALPADGKIVTLELEPRHAEAARRNFATAGVANKIKVIVGPAAASLEALRQKKVEPFDFVFIDADKASTATYFRSALELCHPGSVIVTDNVVRKGQVVDASSTDPSVRGMRAFAEALANERRVEATIVQTVGTKGYDGFIVARVR